MGQITMKAGRGKKYRIIVADREGISRYQDIEIRAQERGVAGRLIDEIEKIKLREKLREEKLEKVRPDYPDEE